MEDWLKKFWDNPYISIIPLTPDDQEKFDPTGKARDFIRKLIDAPTDIRHTPQSLDTTRLSVAQWWSWYSDFVRSVYTDRHRAYWAFDQECLGKCGPQGGTVPLINIADSIIESYTNARRLRQFKRTRLGLAYLYSRIRDTISRYGIPQDVPSRYYNTNASLPTMGKKGTYQAETVSAKPYRHVWPDLLGTRYSFGKPRVIHQTSVLDVRRVELMLAKVRKWLAQYLPDLFGSWLNPRQIIQPMMTKAIGKNWVNVEGDYYHMDEWYSRFHAESILPLYELLLTPSEFQELLLYCEELWTQPLYLGTVMLVGEHDLFSGVPVTQDFETIFSAALHCGVDICNGARRRGSAFIGDDSILLYDRRDLRVAERVKCDLEEESDLLGLPMHPDKTRFNTGDYRYCKRIWYPAVPKSDELAVGAYPLARTLCTIITPERAVAPKQLMSAQLARCDNAFGSPGWHQFVDQVASKCRWELPQPDYFDDATTYLDWWDRVYGERWNPSASITYKWLRK